jgi:hypothetical protein
MGGRNRYLTKKIQPGEIKPMPLENARLIEDADQIVAMGIRSGLISYPRSTRVDPNGKPIPPQTVNVKRSIRSYPCLRAFLLRQQGKTIREICVLIHCHTRVIHDILLEGETIYNRAMQNRKEAPRALPNTGERETPIDPCE